MAEKSEALSVGVLHGPNLNLLGRREPRIYGEHDLDTINRRITERGSELGAALSFFQSNHEGELIDWLQSSGRGTDGLLVNVGAYTHTSLAIRDALLAIERPFVEVHLSNIFAREAFRRHSYLSDISIGVVSGFGADSYLLALEGLIGYLGRR